MISQVNRRISPVIQFSYLHFCLESLTSFGDGGGGDPQQDCLLGYGEFQVREDIGADIAFCEVGMRFPERFRGKVEGIPEHPFQFGPLFILDIAGTGTELLQQLILPHKCMHQHIGINFAAGALTGIRDEPFPLVPPLRG